MGQTSTVTVDDQRRRDDLYEVTLRPHDERVELDGWTYYVRAVKRDSEFMGNAGWLTTELLIDLPLLLFRGLRRVLGRPKPWIVGIVRLGSVRTWNDVQPHVAYREVLAPGVEPAPRITELIDEVRAGRFAPTT